MRSRSWGSTPVGGPRTCQKTSQRPSEAEPCPRTSSRSIDRWSGYLDSNQGNLSFPKRALYQTELHPDGVEELWGGRDRTRISRVQGAMSYRLDDSSKRGSGGRNRTRRGDGSEPSWDANNPPLNGSRFAAEGDCEGAWYRRRDSNSQGACARLGLSQVRIHSATSALSGAGSGERSRLCCLEGS